MDTQQLYDLVIRNGCCISTDTRSINRGDVFFALKGDRFDGNKYASEAIIKGASHAIIDDKSFMQEGTILVDNVLKELQSIALIHRNKFTIPVIAITGTNGKTTTKELLAAVLAQKYRVHCTSGNLNNHIGVPLTILSAPPETEFLIIEVGANHKGEISMLCDIARPSYGIITNIGKAHLEGFGSYEGVVEAKSELYIYISASAGLIFYNSEDEQLNDLIKSTGVKAIPYQRPGNKRMEVSKISEDPFLDIVLNIGNKMYELKTELYGRYNLQNIKAAISSGLYFDVKPERIIRAIEEYTPENNRSQLLNTGKNTVICDAYNSNPESLSQALDSFFTTAGQSKTVIIGDMFELGRYKAEEHEKVLRKIQQKKDVTVYLVGSIFKSLRPDKKFTVFENVIQLNEHLSGNPIRDNLILVKGSRGMQLEKVYDFL